MCTPGDGEGGTRLRRTPGVVSVYGVELKRLVVLVLGLVGEEKDLTVGLHKDTSFCLPDSTDCVRDFRTHVDNHLQEVDVEPP